MFLDTSGLFCFLHRSEPHHENAVHRMGSVPQMLTHNYVLAELVALCRARGLPRTPVLNFVATLEQNRAVQMVYVNRMLNQQAVNLLRERIDKNWSLCDAVSFILMRDFEIHEALTTDHHFEQAGFVNLLK